MAVTVECRSAGEVLVFFAFLRTAGGVGPWSQAPHVRARASRTGLWHQGRDI